MGKAPSGSFPESVYASGDLLALDFDRGDYGLTCMTNARIVDFYPDFVGLRRLNLDVLNRKVFASFPSYGGLQQGLI